MAGDAEADENLSDGQAQLLQSFVNSLQSFSAGMSAVSPAGGSPFREKPQPLLTPPSVGVAVSGSAAPPKKATVFVDMVAKEMEEIMALHEAGLLNLDDDAPAPLEDLLFSNMAAATAPSVAAAAAAAVESESLAPPSEASRQSVIDEEVLALNALMQSGWWDEPSTTSKESKVWRLRNSERFFFLKYRLCIRERVLIQSRTSLPSQSFRL